MCMCVCVCVCACFLWFKVCSEFVFLDHTCVCVCVYALFDLRSTDNFVIFQPCLNMCMVYMCVCVYLWTCIQLCECGHVIIESSTCFVKHSKCCIDLCVILYHADTVNCVWAGTW